MQSWLQRLLGRGVGEFVRAVRVVRHRAHGADVVGVVEGDQPDRCPDRVEENRVLGMQMHHAVHVRAHLGTSAGAASTRWTAWPRPPRPLTRGHRHHGEVRLLQAVQPGPRRR